MPNVYKGSQTWIEPLPEGVAPTKFEIAARALLVSVERVLLVYEADTDTWFTPGGRLNPEESLTDACLREIKEETGLEARLGALIAVTDVIMPGDAPLFEQETRKKFEFIFAATPVVPPDFIERDHVDGDQTGSCVSKIRWFTAEETRTLPRLFPDFIRHWPELIKKQ